MSQTISISGLTERLKEASKKARENKIEKVMREYKHGKLHSGSKKGPKVKSREQAIAIAMSEAEKGKKACDLGIEDKAETHGDANPVLPADVAANTITEGDAGAAAESLPLVDAKPTKVKVETVILKYKKSKGRKGTSKEAEDTRNKDALYCIGAFQKIASVSLEKGLDPTDLMAYAMVSMETKK